MEKEKVFVNKKIWVATLLVLFFTQAGFAQNRKQIDSIGIMIGKIAGEGLNMGKIKDSTALYTGEIIIKVELLDGKQQVKVEVSPYMIDSSFTETKQLEMINYASLMGTEKKKYFIYRLCLMILDSHYSEPLLGFYEASTAIKRLMRKPVMEATELGSYMVIHSKQSYH